MVLVTLKNADQRSNYTPLTDLYFVTFFVAFSQRTFHYFRLCTLRSMTPSPFSLYLLILPHFNPISFHVKHCFLFFFTNKAESRCTILGYIYWLSPESECNSHRWYGTFSQLDWFWTQDLRKSTNQTYLLNACKRHYLHAWRMRARHAAHLGNLEVEVPTIFFNQNIFWRWALDLVVKVNI